MKMFRRYQNLPVRIKLQLIGLATLAVSILLSTLALIANDYRTSIELMQQSLQTQARIVADNSAAPLRFGDAQAAKEALAVLHASTMIQQAEVLLNNGTVFASYQATGHQETLRHGALHPVLRSPIMLKGKQLGELLIHYDPISFERTLLFKGATGGLIALLMMAMAFFVMRSLLRDVIEPISRLSYLMKQVADSQDYSLRSHIQRGDELGDLARGFDGMLEHIEAYRADEVRRSESRLSESESRYNTLVESVPVGVLQLDSTGQFIFANRMFWLMLGQDSCRYDQLSELAFCHPEYRPALAILFQAALSGRCEAPLEMRVHDREGEEVWVAIEVTPLLHAGGTVSGVVGTVLDISQRRRDEARLRLAASVFEASHEAIIITDPEGLIISTNRAFNRITEYSADEVLGCKAALLSAGSTPPEVYAEMWQQLHQTGIWNGELLNRRKSGATYPAWVSIAAVYDAAGQTCNYISLSRDITGIKEENQRIQYLAHYDGLTGLPNRTLFYDRARVELARAQRDGLGFAVLFIDLDRFKWVNDTLGHAVGDALLREVARRLEAGVRASDTVSRFGGDEFVLLLSAMPAEEAAAIAAKLLAEVGGEAICGGHALYITPSIGLSLWSPQTSDLESLIREADEAMYQAKRSGRNKVCIYEHGVPA